MGTIPICSSAHKKTSKKQKPIETDVKPTNFLRSDIRNIYSFDQNPIGVGKYGVVRKAHKKGENSKFYAIKSLFKNSQNLNTIYNEISILNSLDHPNIVKVYEVYEYKDFIHIVMECINGMNLSQFMQANPNMTEDVVAEIMQKIFLGVQYLHINGICHKDLKPENIMVMTKGKEISLKIIDFGLSERFIIKNQAVKMNARVGTPLYVAPEIYEAKPYNEKIDIWSIGIIMYYLLTKKVFSATNSSDLISIEINGSNDDTQYILNNEALKKFKNAKSLLKRLLTTNPNERISSKTALKHKWFKNHIIDYNENIQEFVNSLISYKKPNKIEELIMRTQLRTMEEMNNISLNNIFIFIDNDLDGIISYSQLLNFLTNYAKLSAESIETISINFKSQTNESLSYTDFLMLFLHKEISMKAENFITTIHIDSVTSTKNLKSILELEGAKYSDDQIVEIIKESHDYIKKNSSFTIL